MTTKNIEDVVAEKVEEFREIFELHFAYGDRDIEDGCDWLTTTLTQLVKEVEAGERNKIRHVALTMGDCPINNPEADGGWMKFQHDFVRKITSPTSDVTEK